ncbi:MAG: hypothetical protein ABSB15_09805 [Bryobacteraceae bacterium]|jgi:hypothetical protein
MDLPNILRELHEQLDAVKISIVALERVAAGKGPRRGRPPKWMKEAKEGPPKRRAGGKAGAKRN